MTTIADPTPTDSPQDRSQRQRLYLYYSTPVSAALAEFIRELIVSGTREGLAAARMRGRVGGRPTVVTPEILRAARDMLPNPDNSIESIAKILGVSPGTLYNHVPDLRELRTSRHTTEPDAIPQPKRAQTHPT